MTDRTEFSLFMVQPQDPRWVEKPSRGDRLGTANYRTQSAPGAVEPGQARRTEGSATPQGDFGNPHSPPARGANALCLTSLWVANPESIHDHAELVAGTTGMAEGGDGERATGAAVAAPEALRAPSGTRDVFISYASQDAAVADVVVGALERAGLKCWIAP